MVKFDWSVLKYNNLNISWICDQFLCWYTECTVLLLQLFFLFKYLLSNQSWFTKSSKIYIPYKTKQDLVD